MSEQQPLSIKNSTAEFLIFTASSGGNSVEVRFEDKNLWMTQKMMSVLFAVSVPTINEHLKHIFETKEISEDGAIRNFLITASDGKTYDTKHYNLETIIAIGFRANSTRAIQFRQRAMRVLKQFENKLIMARLNNRQVHISAYIKEHLSVTAKDLLSQYNVSLATIKRDLDLLIKNGIIKSIGFSKSTRYEPVLSGKGAKKKK